MAQAVREVSYEAANTPPQMPSKQGVAALIRVLAWSREQNPHSFVFLARPHNGLKNGRDNPGPYSPAPPPSTTSRRPQPRQSTISVEPTRWRQLGAEAAPTAATPDPHQNRADQTSLLAKGRLQSGGVPPGCTYRQPQEDLLKASKLSLLAAIRSGETTFPTPGPIACSNSERPIFLFGP
jgi:hypothetical protein